MVLTAMYGDKILASLVIHQFMDHPPPDILSVKCWISGGDVITEATADAPLIKTSMDCSCPRV